MNQGNQISHRKLYKQKPPLFAKEIFFLEKEKPAGYALYESGLRFKVFQMKELPPSWENIGIKNEFGFDTEAAISRSVAKRMSEFLIPIFSHEGLIFP